VLVTSCTLYELHAWWGKGWLLGLISILVHNYHFKSQNISMYMYPQDLQNLSQEVPPPLVLS